MRDIPSKLVFSVLAEFAQSAMHSVGSQFGIVRNPYALDKTTGRLPRQCILLFAGSDECQEACGNRLVFPSHHASCISCKTLPAK